MIMVKPYFTRKNLIVIALAFFYGIVVLFTGVCLDGAHEIISGKNIINMLGQSLGFKTIEAGTAGLVTLILICVYSVVLVAAIAYERRYAIVNNKKTTGIKMILSYAATFILSAALSVGVGLLIQTNLKKDIGELLQFISQSLVLGSAIYLVLFGLLAFATMLVVNFINVDKPFKFWDKKEEVDVKEFEEDPEVDVTSSFDVDASANVNGVAAGVGGAGGSSSMIPVQSSGAS